MANMLRRVGVDVPYPVRRFLEKELDSWLRIEEYQESNAIVVRAEAPGINPEKDIEVTLAGNQLQLVVRREEKSEHKGKRGYRSEFHYGTITRSVALPAGAHQDDISASYRDGVLEVRIPVLDQPMTGSRKIPIARG